MAVAHDAITESATWTTTSPHTFNHTPSGTPQGVIVLIGSDGASTNVITGVTYGGVAMARIGFRGVATGALYAYFLGASIPTSTQTVSITHTGSAAIKWGACATVTAAGDTEPGHVYSTVASLVTTQNVFKGNRAGLVYQIAFNAAALTNLTLGAGFTDLNVEEQTATPRSFRIDRETTTSSGALLTAGYTQSVNNTYALLAANIAEVGTGAYVQGLPTLAIQPGTSTTSVSLPPNASEVVDRDLYVFALSRDSTSASADVTCTDNSGVGSWTSVAGDADKKLWVWWKRGAAADFGATVAVASAVGSLSVAMLSVKGSNGASGNPTTNLTLETNASGDETHAGITPTNPASVVVFAVGDYSNDTNAVTALAGATMGTLEPEWFEILSTGGSDCRLTVTARTLASGGTGSLTWSQINGTTKSVAFAVAPAAGGPNDGSATGAITWVGSATGTTVRSGSASGTIAWAGSATGTQPLRGSATGTIAWVGSATGVSVHRGAATGTVTWAGTATGAVGHRGASSGAITWAGTATGTNVHAGSATGAVSWVGVATGREPAGGAATGAVSWVGSATGESPAVGAQEGEGLGAITWAGAATGITLRTGAATGSIAWVGVATGVVQRRGAATGSVTWAGVSSGAVAHRGAATGTIGWVGTATGMVAHRGASTGAVAWVGVAAGRSLHAGSATGSVTWVGAATGAAAHRGAAVGTITWAGTATGGGGGVGIGSIAWVGTATGRTTRSGAGSGTVTWVGSATGSAPVVPPKTGAATGTVIRVGSATGITVRRGAGNGTVTWVGVATGKMVLRGAATGTITWVGVSSGIRRAGSSAVGTIGWVGIADGIGSYSGAAIGGILWAGLAQGPDLPPGDYTVVIGELREGWSTGSLHREWTTDTPRKEWAVTGLRKS